MNARLLELGPAQADVWVAFVDEAFDAVAHRPELDVMSSVEWEKLSRFVLNKDRRRYRVTRLLVRHVLSRYAPIPPHEWTFGSTDFGRPLITNDGAAARSIRFNISHSDKVVMIAVTRELEVGIDVEDLDRDVPLDVASSLFAASEVSQLSAMPHGSKLRRFLDIWTLKESYIKAHGKGLSLPLDQFSFDLDREGEVRFEVCPGLHEARRHWSFWTWQPSLGSVTALCLGLPAGAPVRIQTRRTLPLVAEELMHLQMQRSSVA